MKRNNVPIAFTMPEVIQFLKRSDYKVEEQIKNLKIEHNRLKDKYFAIIRESSFPKPQFRLLSQEYNELFLATFNLALLHRDTSYVSTIREVCDVVEDTMFAIWKYMYDNKMSA